MCFLLQINLVYLDLNHLRVHENSVASILVAPKISSRCRWKWATLKDYHQTTPTCHFTKLPKNYPKSSNSSNYTLGVTICAQRCQCMSAHLYYPKRPVPENLTKIENRCNLSRAQTAQWHPCQCKVQQQWFRSQRTWRSGRCWSHAPQLLISIRRGSET